MDGRKIFKLSSRSGIGYMDWIDMAQNTNRERAVVTAAKKPCFH
jgi:hypothetical protein